MKLRSERSARPNEIDCLINFEEGPTSDFTDEEEPDLLIEKPSHWIKIVQPQDVNAANRVNIAANNGVNIAANNEVIVPLKTYTEEEAKKITSKAEIIRLLTERNITFDQAFGIAHLRY